MTTKIAIVLVGLLFCLGCDKSATPPDPRIAQFEAEIKKLKSGDKSLDAAKKAMRELRKVNSVVEMGINYPNYTKILLEAKPSFDEALLDVPEGKLKTSLSVTMKVYIDAGTFWSWGTQRGDENGQLYISDADKAQFSAYNLDLTEGYIFWEGKLPKIWAFATVSLTAAEELIKQETTKP